LIPLYLKTIYKDEPVFRSTRVIYSVFNNEVHGDLGQDFARKASLNSISDEDLETFGVGELSNLHIGAMKHADAVVKCGESLHPQVEKHLSESHGKPILQHEEDELASKYLNFYDSVLAAGN
jgi:starch synthase